MNEKQYIHEYKNKNCADISTYVFIFRQLSILLLSVSAPINKNYHLNDNFYNEFRDILLNYDCSLFVSDYWIRVNPHAVWLYFIYDKDRVSHYSVLSILNIVQQEDGFFELDVLADSSIKLYKLSNKYTIKKFLWFLFRIYEKMKTLL